jgi:hypothetical protein
MPSDTAIETIEGAFAETRASFRSAVTHAVEEMRTMIDAHTAPAGDRSMRTAAELGEFAAGRIDMDRFTAITSNGDTLDPAALALLDRARATLAGILAARGAQFTVNVVPGGDVVADVGASLATIGRAFGAARAAELVRLGRSGEARDDSAGAFPFHRWTRAERRMAPPLVVHVVGGDLQAAGLAPFLDGTQKVVLVVEGDASPAPLIRLITPGVFVMQTTDATDLKRLASFEGPGIAALMSGESAQFVHDPSAGAALAERLVVTHVPAAPKRALGRLSLFEQLEELHQLEWLADMVKQGERPIAAGSGAALASGAAEAAVAAGPKDAVVTPADRLAALLLRQAGLSNVA